MLSIHSRFSIQWRHALALVLFLLPWQTRLILRQITWNGGVWEYGTFGIYATEIVLLGVMVWFVIFRARAVHAARASDEQDGVFTRMRAALLASKKICWCAGFFLAWFLHHLFFAPFPWVQIQAFVRILEASLLFYFIYSAREHARFLQWSFLAGLGAQAALALVQFFTQHAFASRLFGMADHPAWAGGSAVIETESGRWLRAYGGLPHPNILGGYMAIGALLVAIQLLKMPREKTLREAFKVSAALLSLILLVSGLIVSFSRSAILAFASGLVIISLQYLRKIRNQASNNREVSRVAFRQGSQTIALRIGIIWLSGFLAAAVFFVLAPDVFITRARGQTRLERQSISERVLSYKSALEVARRDGLWGTGLGNYTAALYALDPTRHGWEYQPVHNASALAFLELGFVMSIVLIWFLFSFFRARFLAVEGELLVPLIVVAMFDHYLWSLWSGLVLCAVACALLRTWRIKNGMTV